MKKNILVISLTLVFALLLTGCSTTYYYSESSVNAKRSRLQTSINSFGNYNLQGKTFYIESGNDKISSNDLEFLEYADYVAKSLKSNGANKINDKKNADMCILVTYEISDKSYTETVPLPIWGRTGISSISTTSRTLGTAYGTAQSNYLTSTTTNVIPSYGITGYSSVDKKVTMFRRVLNIYAYDNKQPNEAIMLWKTNILSDGSSSDLRNVLPAMAFCGIEYLGKSNRETKNLSIFEDQENFLSWKEGSLPDPNVVSYPKFYSSNANPNKIVISKISRTTNETIIEFVAYNSDTWFTISPSTYIEFDMQKFKVISADNIKLGEMNDITKYRAWEFRLHFPAIPSNVDYINISEGEYPGWKWDSVILKN